MWCCMPSLVEILCCLDEEIGLVCWQLMHDMHATEIFFINFSVANMAENRTQWELQTMI